MRILSSRQLAPIGDQVQARLAMVASVLDATLYSLATARADRFGGYDEVLVVDLAREFREGHGDAGICFEYAVHEAIARKDKLIFPLAADVLNRFCGIKGEAHSLLFGPEKNGRIPILESVNESLTQDSRLYVGNRGHPPRLKQYIPKIINAYHRSEERNSLPRSIRGVWKADLFLGNQGVQKWVATTVKIRGAQLQGAQGLRVGIYPQVDKKDGPRKDDKLNLIRLPLPYDNEFMEVYYKSFFLVRAFLNADANMPPEIALPDAEDRVICGELARRRNFKVAEVAAVLRDMSQSMFLAAGDISNAPVSTTLSAKGLAVGQLFPVSDLVSLAPRPMEE